MKLSRLISIALVISSLSCAHNQAEPDSQKDAVAQASAIKQKSYASLKEAFNSKEENPSLGKMRRFSFSITSPLVSVEGSSDKKPFFLFHLDRTPENIESLTVKVSSVSLQMQKVGTALPALFVLRGNNLVEIKPDETLHRSVLGDCLTSYYSFPIKDYAKKGTTFLVVNVADGFDNSMGKIIADNPNLNLDKTVGLCSLVDVYPYELGSVEVTAK